MACGLSYQVAFFRPEGVVRGQGQSIVVLE